MGPLSDCSRNADPSSYRIQAGDIYLYGDQKLLSVSQIIVHPDYVSVLLGADVALLRLEERADFSANVKPVKLSSLNLQATQKNQCWVTGWGIVDWYSKCWRVLGSTQIVGAKLAMGEVLWMEVNRSRKERERD